MSTPQINDETSTSRVVARNPAIALACWVAVALLAGCGTQSPKADPSQADSAVESTDAPHSADSTDSTDETDETATPPGIEEAGTGDTQDATDQYNYPYYLYYPYRYGCHGSNSYGPNPYGAYYGRNDRYGPNYQYWFYIQDPC